MKRYFYTSKIKDFLNTDTKIILGEMAAEGHFPLTTEQRDAWLAEMKILRRDLKPYRGTLFFEYTIPRMGRRVDVVLIIQGVIFVLEFKVGARDYTAGDYDQTWDYALDLKNFHEASHDHYVAPVLVATKAAPGPVAVMTTPHQDRSFFPIRCTGEQISTVISAVLSFTGKSDEINPGLWIKGRYRPTPTIIEAAMALYNHHSVEELSRSDAGAINLSLTSGSISEIIRQSREASRKAICFVTGVPGSGKTLVGLNIATSHIDQDSELYSVFLSGNGPLVAILREALVRDRVSREKEKHRRMTKRKAYSEVKAFIQNVHSFRDDCLVDMKEPPIEHVALFDEAQRAWDYRQTVSFMRQKRKTADFNMSEPEFLISCMDRHRDWAVVVCLVGGGQEINTGEAGIGEWIQALEKSFSHWHIYLSDQLTDSEYGAGTIIRELQGRKNVSFIKELHLAVSMRSFRAENLSLLVKQLLDCDMPGTRASLGKLQQYPVMISRDLAKAKEWLRKMARGSERYGMIVSSQAERLKPHAIDVRPKIDPIHWFLNGKDDTRSSYYLEDVVTEFQVQGLELDWACVVWDADLRYSEGKWFFNSFRGDRWMRIKKVDRQRYLLNAYRVLLTRARQGMVIVVPPGAESDPTRKPEFYDPTFEYLKEVGFDLL